jgi:hypothetical protein
MRLQSVSVVCEELHHRMGNSHVNAFNQTRNMPDFIFGMLIRK